MRRVSSDARTTGERMFWILPWGQENRVKHVPWATYALIAINVAVHALVALNVSPDDDGFLMRYALPADGWRPYQLLTSSFLHADVFHLFGNMLFLWLFGESIEDALGPLAFLTVYFVGGVLGDLVYVHNNVGSIPSLGASGCVAAIAGAYGAMFYDRTIDIRAFFLIFPIGTFAVRAFVVVLLWFGLDLWLTWTSAGRMDETDTVNYVVHGVGFAVGALVGVVARLQGVMRRYERLSRGHPWWGYWPDSLERRYGRAPSRRR